MDEIGITKENMTKLKTPITIDHEMIDIDTSLTKLFSKKHTPKPEMLSITQDYLKDNYPDIAQIYTDGSKNKDRVGSAYTCEIDNKHEHFRITDNTSILTAELTALDKALQHAILDHQNEKVVIITDSLSSLDSCKDPDGSKTARPDIIETIYNRHDWLVKRNTKLTLLWAPSHINLKGNEIADSLANQGTKRNWVNEHTKLSPSEIGSLIKAHMRTKFQNIWDEYTKCKLFKSIYPSMKKTIDISTREQKLNRLRLNVPAFHLSRDKACETCRKSLTPNHVLMNCIHFDGERELVRTELEKSNLILSEENILHPDRKGLCKELILAFVEAINRMYYI